MPQDRVPISKRLVLINAVSQIATRLLYVTVIFWAIRYLIERVPVEEYALLSVVIAVTEFVPVLQNLLAGSVSRFITEAYAQDDRARITQLVSTMFPILLIAGVVVTLIGLLVAWQCQWIFRLEDVRVPDARFMVILLLSSAGITLPLAPFSVGLVVCQRFVLQNMLQVGSTFLRIALLLILLLGVGAEVKWIVVAQVVANLSFVFAKVVVSRHLIPDLKFQVGRVDKSLRKRVLSLNGWQAVFGISGMIGEGAPPLILKWFATAVDVTAFDVSARIDREMRRFTTMASQPLNPVLTAMHATESKDRLANAFLRGGRFGLWVVLLPVTLLVVFRQEVYQFYLATRYEELKQSATVFFLLTMVYPSFYARWMYHKIAMATENLRAVSLLTLAMHSMTMVASIYLVRQHELGAVGHAIAAVAISTAFNLLVFWPLSIRTLHISWRRFAMADFVPGIVPAIVTGCFCLVLRQVFGPQQLWSLGVCFLLGTTIYGLLLYRYCLLESDRRDLAQLGSRLGIAGKSASTRADS